LEKEKKKKNQWGGWRSSECTSIPNRKLTDYWGRVGTVQTKGKRGSPEVRETFQRKGEDLGKTLRKDEGLDQRGS